MFSVKLMAASSQYTFGEGTPLATALFSVKFNSIVNLAGRSYEALAQEALGPRIGKVLVELTIGTYVLGAITGYVNIVGTTLTPLVNAISPTTFCVSPRIVQIVIAAAFFFPLSSLKSMAMFRFTGFAAFLCIMFVAAAIVSGGIQAIIAKGPAIASEIDFFNLSFDSIFNALPVVGFAFVFHSAFFPIWKSMADPSEKKISWAAYLALGLCALVYTSLSSFGYVSFGRDTNANIMANYPTASPWPFLFLSVFSFDSALRGFNSVFKFVVICSFCADTLMVVAKAAYMLVVIAAYPINCFVLRSSIDRLLFSRQPAPWWRCILLAFVLVVVSVVLAMVFAEYSVRVGYCGRIAWIYFVLYFPCFILHLACGQQKRHGSFLAPFCFVVFFFLFSFFFFLFISVFISERRDIGYCRLTTVMKLRFLRKKAVASISRGRSCLPG